MTAPSKIPDDAFNEDIEPNNSSAAAQSGLSFVTPAVPGLIRTTLTGTFDSTADVDVFEFVAPAETGRLSIGFTGSTRGPGQVSVLSTGGERLARLSVPSGSREMRVPITPSTSYRIEVTPADGELGSNPFWVMTLLTTREETQLEGVEGNETSASAIELIRSRDELFRIDYYSAGGELGDGDVDWWRFFVVTGQTIELDCGARRLGSGALNAQVSLFANPMEPALQTETETETTDLRWGNDPSASRAPVVATASGEYFLSVVAGDGDPVVTSRHYRCQISVRSPD